MASVDSQLPYLEARDPVIQHHVRGVIETVHNGLHDPSILGDISGVFCEDFPKLLLIGLHNTWNELTVGVDDGALAYRKGACLHGDIFDVLPLCIAIRVCCTGRNCCNA